MFILWLLVSCIWLCSGYVVFIVFSIISWFVFFCVFVVCVMFGKVMLCICMRLSWVVRFVSGVGVGWLFVISVLLFSSVVVLCCSF